MSRRLLHNRTGWDRLVSKALGPDGKTLVLTFDGRVSVSDPVAGFSVIANVTAPPAPSGITFADVGLTGATGWIWHGNASATYVNSDGPAGGTPDVADATNDPVGYAADTSGADSHQVQALSGNKPALHVYPSGTKALKVGRAGGTARYLASASGPLGYSNPMTVAAVVELIDTGGNSAMFFSNLNPTATQGFTYLSVTKAGAGFTVWYQDGYIGWSATGGGVTIAGASVGDHVIAVYHRPGPGVLPTRLRVYSMAGALIGEGSPYSDLSGYTYTALDGIRTFTMGGDSATWGTDHELKVPFMLAANQAISAPNEATLVSTLVAQFGGAL